jgi:hypothetical protein
MYKPIGIFFTEPRQKIRKNLQKQLFSPGQFFYTTSEKTKSEGKYLMKMTEY